MHNRFDRFAKDVLREAFNTVGQSSTEVDITADSQRADLCFVPGPSHDYRPDDIGLLARIATTPCLVEPYRQPPGTAEMRDCLRKLLTWQHMREHQDERARADIPVEAELEAPAETPIAVLWVLCSGRPETAIAGFALSPLDGWPSGVYAGSLPALPYRLIVLSELPEDRSTLLLRLLGRGLTLRRAVRELAALDPDAWERRHAAPLLVQLRIEIEEIRATGLWPASEEEQEIIVTAQEIVASIEKKARDQGFQAVLFHQFARKLGRELTEAEQASVRQRLDLVGPDRVGDIALDLGAEALAAWLADRDAR